MLPVIDFRNGRYQGEARGGLPNGVGIFFSAELVFVVGHWREGVLEGRTIIIYPDATSFCGTVREGLPEGLCYYELERENIKVYFEGSPDDREGRLAITIPNFSSILAVNSATLAIIAETQLRPGDNKGLLEEVSRIVGKEVVVHGREYEGFIHYFEQHFADPYSDIFEQLILNVNGSVEYWMGFRLEGLGVKIRPLPLQESGGRSYRVSEMGVMTRENVLFGVGVKSSSSVLGRVQVEEGIFALPHTLASYRLSEGPNDKTRPAKCLAAFLNFLKRSLDFRDDYLVVKEVAPFKVTINRIHQLTFTEMKEKKAHEIIQSPLKDEAVRSEIERKRRKREEESEFFQRNKRTTHQQPNIYNTGTNISTGSAFNLASLREDLERSISKRKLSKSKVTPAVMDKQYESPPKPLPVVTPVNKSSEKRLNGSITPTKARKPSDEKKPVGVMANKAREGASRNLPTKYPERDAVRERDAMREREEERPPVPAPVLKRAIPQSSPSKRKVSYRDKELEEWQRAQVKFGKASSPPKKYGRETQGSSRAGSPGKIHSRPLFTQNIFQ